MSNRAYLYNTSIATSNPALLREKLSEPGFDYAEVASASYIVPVAWLCCFRPGDLQAFRYRDGDDDDDVSVMDLALPVVSVQQALANLRAAMTLLISIAGDEKLGRAYFLDAVRCLESLPLPYLTIDPTEVMMMGDMDEFAQQLRGALAGNLNAKRDLKTLSGYVDGALPYPPEVLYAVPTNLDKARRINSVALDIGYGRLSWRLSKGSPSRPDERRASGDQPNLVSIAEGMRKGLKLRKHEASVGYGFVAVDPTRPQQLKLLILTKTEDERAKLLADKTLMDVLFGMFQDDLETVCTAHGFEWLGYVIASRPLITDTLGKKLDDWVSVPAYERDGLTRSTESADQATQSAYLKHALQKAAQPQDGGLSLAPIEPPAPQKRSDSASTARAGNASNAGATPYAKNDPNIIYYETPEPPRLFSKSTDGRIGRLRFIAFCAISHALFFAAVFWAVAMAPFNTRLAFLGLIPGIFSLWVGIRAVAMRLHDVNLSGKWMLGLFLLAVGLTIAQHESGAQIGAGLMWLAMIGLAVWPGDGDFNSYDAPGGTEPLWTRIVACAWLALIPLAMLGYSEQRKLAKRMQDDAIAQAQAQAQGQPRTTIAPSSGMPVPATPYAGLPPPMASSASATSHDQPVDENLPAPTHGGKVYGREHLNYEIVVSGRVVTVYMTDQDQGYDLEGATGDFSYRLMNPQVVRRIPLQPVGKDQMTGKIPDEAFDPGDIIHLHITPLRKAGSSFEVEVPGAAK